jgi:hypothetical protein
MRTLTQADFLALWETGRSLHPLDQGVLAAQSAFPELEESVADWPLGRRNRALAQLRRALFGLPLRGWTACRQCAEQLEFQLDGKALAESEAPAGEERMVVGELSYRLPTSRDLAAVAEERDAAQAARRLVRQCCVADDSVEREWSEEEIEAVGERMAAADPLAEILLRFDCPSCGASFDESLDLTSFLWAEMEGRAKRMLLEVHTLASAYGWSEAEILSLSPARREVYLEMARA